MKAKISKERESAFFMLLSALLLAAALVYPLYLLQ